MALRCCLTVFSKGVSCLVSRVLLSAWFALCLVFVLGKLVHVNAGVGLWRLSFVCHLCQVCDCFLASETPVGSD